MRYWWMHDGGEERCLVERVPVPTGSVCEHCGAPFMEDGTGAIRITCEEDGSAHVMHECCAVEGVDGSDIEIVRLLVLVVECP